jgi:hypothetical protein
MTYELFSIEVMIYVLILVEKHTIRNEVRVYFPFVCFVSWFIFERKE